MVMSVSPRSARRWSRLRFGVLLLVTALVGHDAVFASQFGLGDGFRQAMTAGGHDGYWMAFSVVIVALGMLALAREAVRGWRLSRQAAGHEVRRRRVLPQAETAGFAGYVAELRRIWPRLFVATALLFTIQENLEHVAAGQATHGLGSLIGTEHPFAVPVLAVVVGMAAALGALVRWRVRLLEIRAANAAAHRPPMRGPRVLRPARSWWGIAAIHRFAWFLVRLDASRAPPAGA
jgi:hypothetical protein